MRKLTLPAKRVDPEQLRAELLVVGVPLRPGIPGLPPMDVHLSGTELVLVIAADNDQYDAIATQVIQDHSPPAELKPQQAKRRAAKAALRGSDDAFKLAMIAGFRVLVARIPGITWDQFTAAVDARIDSETT